jgi:sec-independent protein translocase protein TatA
MGLDNPIHIMFLLAIALLVFGAKRLPEVGQSLGHGIRGFKDAISGELPTQIVASPVQEPVAVPVPAVTADTRSL